MADLNDFKLSYCLRRRIICLLDQLNEFLLIKKLDCKNLNDDQYQFLKDEIKDLIDKISDLELINSCQRKKIKLNNNDVIYLNINNNLQEKIIKILSNNKKFCLTKNLELIISENDKIKQIIEDNNELINELLNLNDFNFNSIFIKQEKQINLSSNLNNQINTSSNLNNQIDTSSNLNQNQPFNLNQSTNLNSQNKSANSDNDYVNRNMKIELYEPLSEFTSDDDDIIEIIEDEISPQNIVPDDLRIDNNFHSTELNDNNNQLTDLNDNNDQLTDLNDNNNQSTELIDNNQATDELIIINLEDLNIIDVHWFVTNNLINFKNTISWNNNFFTTELIEKFTNLKYLKISFIIDKKFNLNVINNFKHLEQLDIFILCELNENICLDLNQLKIIQIEHDHRIKRKLTINSSNLKHLYCDCLKILNIIYKDSVQTISTKIFDNSILKFKNLKIINCFQDIDDSYSLINDDQLKSIIKIEISQFKNLKMINFIILDFLPNYGGQSIKKIFEKWFNGKQQNSDIKFYLSNLEINNLGFLQEILNKLNLYKDNDNKMRIFYDNLDKLEPNFNYLNTINFNILIDYLNDQQFTDLFFKKFNNIRAIKTSKKIIDSETFLKFLTKLDKLTEIDLYQPHLDQEFYDKFSKLKNLIINFSLIETKIELNYKFLFNFKLLINLNLSENLKFLNFSIDLMKELNILGTIQLSYDDDDDDDDDKIVKLKRYQEDLYELKLKNISDNPRKSNKYQNNLLNKKIKLDELKKLCSFLIEKENLKNN